MLVKHLICACTGLPRQDFEWLFEFKGVTPDERAGHARDDAADQQVRRDVPVLEPARRRRRATSAGTSRIPQLELGAAYDKAMQTLVFDPLGMKATTFDYAKALAGNHAARARARRRRQARARGHGAQLLDHPGASGGRRLEQRQRHAASTSQMELAEGKLPDGTRYISQEHAARAPRAAGRRSARTPPTAWA